MPFPRRRVSGPPPVLGRIAPGRVRPRPGSPRRTPTMPGSASTPVRCSTSTDTRRRGEFRELRGASKRTGRTRWSRARTRAATTTAAEESVTSRATVVTRRSSTPPSQAGRGQVGMHADTWLASSCRDFKNLTRIHRCGPRWPTACARPFASSLSPEHRTAGIANAASGADSDDDGAHPAVQESCRRRTSDPRTR